MQGMTTPPGSAAITGNLGECLAILVPALPPGPQSVVPRARRNPRLPSRCEPQLTLTRSPSSECRGGRICPRSRRITPSCASITFRRPCPAARLECWGGPARRIPGHQHPCAAQSQGSYPAGRTISAYLADDLCRLATGGGLGGRKFYTNDGEATFNARRPVLLTGINDVATRGDLADRTSACVE
jgi:hypothetical protein